MNGNMAVLQRLEFAGVPVSMKNWNWEGSVKDGNRVKKEVFIGFKNGEVRFSYFERNGANSSYIRVSMHAKPSKNLKMDDIELKSFTADPSKIQNGVVKELKGQLIDFLNNEEVKNWLKKRGISEEIRKKSAS